MTLSRRLAPGGACVAGYGEGTATVAVAASRASRRAREGGKTSEPQPSPWLPSWLFICFIGELFSGSPSGIKRLRLLKEGNAVGT